jgi:hypothetical protein
MVLFSDAREASVSSSSLILSCVVVAAISVWVLFDARSRDWSRTGYSGYSPVFWAAGTALLAIVFVPAYLFARRATRRRVRETADGETLTMKRCPKCAEQVLRNAEVCRYCKHEFVRQHHWYDGFKWALAVVALIVGAAYFSGGLDSSVAALGLNTKTCATNLFGHKMCGDELVQFCKDNYAPSNSSACNAALDEAGFDPTQIAASKRRDERAYNRCMGSASSVDEMGNCEQDAP